MEKIVNFRDLGGYIGHEGRQVKPKLLLRSGELYELTENDRHELTTTYNLGKIIDLRRQKEIIKTPDDKISGVTYHHVDILAEFNRPDSSKHELLKGFHGEDVDKNMQELYSEIVRDEVARKEYRNMIQLLLQFDGKSSIFHCFAGKDRTGLAAALILGILGVSYTDIMTDFLQTNVQRKAANDVILAEKRAEGATEAELQGIEKAFCVAESYLAAAKETVNTEFGGFEAYLLNGLGLTETEILKFREFYLA
ncbi:aldo/keto reductase [Lactococcus hodotermopsidis]|uniref:Aldo/keto reductase n=1 Tax=Pseudolactococcus hodotermopsidis TaxID=2709157 RepID=A0A6A0BAY9_9LACT|nr:tyrosine-protein phosphatase [Lactococcus hodotermopsidis]GFH41835.1 aldo/keto reductase [Lactococcus hodotermopsidis]